MQINKTDFTAASDYFSSIILPDSIADVQRIKGIRLALASIVDTIAGIEKLLQQNIEPKKDTQFITHNSKRAQKWIKKIIKTAKIKNRYPLLGDPFIMDMPSSGKLTVSLEKLTLSKVRLNSENTNLFLMLDRLRRFKQKLQYNIEIIYITSVLYKSDYILYSIDRSKDSQTQNSTQPPVTSELFTIIRRYCTRLTSSLLPAGLKSLYFKLFVLLLKHTKRLCTTYPTTLPLQTRKDIFELADTVTQAGYEQKQINTLNTLRSLLNKILHNPCSLFQGVCVYG
jgi:hypothetical protein